MKQKFLCLLLALTLVLGLAATVSAESELNGDTAMLLVYNGSDTEVTVPATIDGIPVSDLGLGMGGNVFGAVADTMTSVTIEDGITHINAGAFNTCTALKQVTIPDSMVLIGWNAFSGCTSLTEIELNEGLLQIQDYAFLNTGLTSIYIPATVTTIYDYALGCTGEPGDLKFDESFAIFGYTGTKAEEYARDWHFTFYRLEDMTDTSGRCGNNTFWQFEESTGTLYITCNNEMEGQGHTDAYYNSVQPWIAYADSIRRVVVGEGVSHLGDHSFSYHYPNLTEVVLPESMTSLGNGAFQGCTNLSKCDFPLGLCYFGGSTFRGTALKEVVFSADMEHAPNIGGRCFADCPELTYVKFPTAFDHTGDGVFANCPKLSRVDMSGMTYSGEVGHEMFRNCDSLTNIDFHTLSEIKRGMYQDCDGLTDITISESVFYLHTDAFADCDNLTNVFFLGDGPSYNANVFRNATLTAWYPVNNTTWTDYHFHDHGGNIRWCAYDPELFLDVAVDEFYYDSVVWAVENGITSGISPNRFAPNDVCLRSQVVTFLWRAAGEPIVEFENPFVDVKPTDYYYNAVLWAVSEGITNGIDSTHFRPNDTCNRSQVVTFLHRAAGEPIVRADNPFTDVKTTDYYYDAVLWAAKNGVTNGITPSTFVPFQTCNRSQIVTFLYRSDNIPEPEIHSFELINSDPTEETGYVFCEGTEFAAGESVIFYAEPWYGYLAQFEVNAEDVELYYLGGNYYELIMPDQDVVMTAHFVPATGDYHYINMTCSNSFAVVDCLTDEDYNDIAKPGEFVQIFIFPNEGCTFSENRFFASANGKPMKDWWYLGYVEDDPEYGTIHIVEMLMPDADVSISINCPYGAAPTAAAEVRIPVSVN